MPEDAVTVFVVDDDAAVRHSLAQLLHECDFSVETYPSADAFLTRAPYRGLGCVILDLHLPGLSGVELQERLDRSGTNLPIVFLSGRGDVPSSVRAMKQGAMDFLTKPVDVEVLLGAVREAVARQAQMRDQQAARDAIRARAATLTRRELDVLRGVISGASNKQIAAGLGIAEKTVKVHRGRVIAKMRTKSVAELVRLCERAGIEAEALR